MRGFVIASLLTLAAGTCDFCAPWSVKSFDETKSLKFCHTESNSPMQVGGYFLNDEAACQAAGGARLGEETCKNVKEEAQEEGWPDVHDCPYDQANLGSVCCGGVFETPQMKCDVCAGTSGKHLMLDSIYTYQCKGPGYKHVGAEGEYADLAACKAAGGEVLEPLYCFNFYAFKDHQGIVDHCSTIQSAHADKCCGSNPFSKGSDTGGTSGATGGTSGATGGTATGTDGTSEATGSTKSTSVAASMVAPSFTSLLMAIFVASSWK